jgi:hypothetical protein
MGSLGPSRIIDAGKWGGAPQRRVIVDGEPRTIKYPGRPHRLLLDLAGNVVAIPLNAGLADDEDLSAEAQKKLNALHAKGWFPYWQCPVALALSGLIPSHAIPKELAHEHPCAPGTYGSNRACPHTIAIERIRKTAQAELRAEQEARARSAVQRELELRQAEIESMRENSVRQQELMTELIDRVGDLMTAPRKKEEHDRKRS